MPGGNMPPAPGGTPEPEDFGNTGPGVNLQSTPVTQVPEPGTLALLSAGLLGFGLRRRRSRQR
jgi:hypothetical protein